MDKIRILIADDESRMRKLVSDFLIKEGYEVTEASDGNEALDRFYDLVKPVNGARWYDKDPIISKTVEILRVVPPEVQYACAERFIGALRSMGIPYESPNEG